MDIELGFVCLDQIAFQKEGFQFVVGDDVVQVVDELLQYLSLMIEAAAGLKVGAHTVLEILGLANIDRDLIEILEKVDPRFFRQGLKFFLKHSLIITRPLFNLDFPGPDFHQFR